MGSRKRAFRLLYPASRAKICVASRYKARYDTWMAVDFETPPCPMGPEAVEAAARQLFAGATPWEEVSEEFKERFRELARACIAKACQAEGLTVERQPSETPGLPEERRLVGSWRNADRPSDD